MTAAPAARSRYRIDVAASIPFFALHAAALGAVCTGVSPTALGICLLTYTIRMFGITAGYHRYFSHRTFQTTRWFQFVLAWLGSSALQKGVLWWAAHHRAHHAHSDTAEDPHSPVVDGFWWSHMGWFLANDFDRTEYRLIPDLARFPELRFLNRWHALPGAVMAAGVLAAAQAIVHFFPRPDVSALQIFLWGFFVSTVACYHATFSVNSLAHRWGSRRFATRDDSRNNFWIALATLGEGWHNNHHFSPSRECQGIRWWEIDVAHYGLCTLRWFGIVWEIRTGGEHRH